MSAVGTTLLHSPGFHIGLCPHFTLGIHEPKSNIELRRSGTITRAFVLRLRSAAPLGLNKCVPIINPGLAHWAMQGYRPYRAHLRLPIYFIILMQLPCNDSMKPLGDFLSDPANSPNPKLSYGRL